MRYRNVEGVRMTEQTDRKHHHGNGNKKEHAHVARGVEGERGGRGGVQVRRGKNPRQGESLDKD